jgi:hypothetical protein
MSADEEANKNDSKERSDRTLSLRMKSKSISFALDWSGRPLGLLWNNNTPQKEIQEGE